MIQNLSLRSQHEQSRTRKETTLRIYRQKKNKFRVDFRSGVLTAADIATIIINVPMRPGSEKSEEETVSWTILQRQCSSQIIGL